MSEDMLHGVLNMPPELWNNDSPIDVSQRHSRYIEASKRIYELEEELQQAREYADRLVEHKDMVCLPADLANLREANAAFAIENHDLEKQRDEYKQALQSAESHNHEMLVSLEKSREQRDRYKAALEEIEDRFTTGWNVYEDHRFMGMTVKQALEGGINER